jgi:hypothetical protein
MLAWLLNTAWMLASRREAARFRRATRRVAEEQAALLAGLLRRNRDSWFGRRHGFARLTAPADYQRAVPVMTPEAFASCTERIGRGEAGVLTSEPVLLLQPTSGTTGAEKLVPYTASLRREMQRAVAAWVADLFGQRPAVRAGRAYWSISPALPRRATPGGPPVGFDDDVAYLSAGERWLVRRLLVRPAAARDAPLGPFRLATLAALLAAPDLALVSVWSPTFLLALLALLDTHAEEVLRLLPARRRGEVAGLLSAGPGAYGRLWPRLAVVSCWADAAAAAPARRLHDLLPQAEVQPKGLMATEGVVSFPLEGRAGAALAVRSHFFELEEVGGRARLAHELDRGGRYRVLLTTGGGLYRYPLGDEVEVTGFEGRCPLLRFLGRAGRVSDRVGEKLAEPFVRDVIERVLFVQGLTPSFAMLAPREGRPDHYVLYLQGARPDEQRLEADLQAALEESPHYAYACGLGQLGPARVRVVPAERGSAWGLFEARWLELGQKAGDVKPAALDPWPGWAEVFR